MKKIAYAFWVLTLLLISACSDEDVVVNELEGLTIAKTFTNDSHIIELYTTDGTFQTGYNAISFQIKNADGSLVDEATASWSPVMHMMNMNHSCPTSEIAKKDNAKSTYSGFIVFQMASNEMEYWELSINYSINGAAFVAKEKIQVAAASKRVVESFMGSDSKRYIVALVEPANPRVALNDMMAIVYQMESMMSFVPVSDYTLKIDPRMPGMNNHSSPNNVDLVEGDDLMYHGKLSLTMTGYWKINLQLQNSSGTVIKGEPVTETNESSSIFFEIEF